MAIPRPEILSKALKTLNKFKKGALKSCRGNNNYLVIYHLRHAQINLALGVVAEFETSLNNALTTSKAAFGETSTAYATTLLDVAEIYLDYGNFRIARQHVENAEDILTRTNELSDALKGRIVLAKSEALIGQGFANDALKLLTSIEHTSWQGQWTKKPVWKMGRSRRKGFPRTKSINASMITHD